tara:strand:+ start:123 stop:3485 length:3363 start_codon:yes stop_codon:yes gene_type:complete
METIDEKLDLLKVKPLPKKPAQFDFFIEKKKDLQLPTIIDKTGEELINAQQFINKIQNQIGIYDTDKLSIIKPEETFKPPLQEPIKLKQLLEDTFTEIVKTDELIKLLPFGATAKTNKDKTKLPDLPGVEAIKKTEYKKKSKLISDYQPGKDDVVGDSKLKDRLPKLQSNILIKTPDYYLYNREIFINAVNKLFLPYKEELLQEEKDIAEGKITVSCDESLKKDFSLLTHQKIVRDYINLFTPYRGILLYHGLGSGKTCSSIAIAEGIKNDLKILVMTPASLRDNYYEELKKCGDYMYKKNQYWEFIDTSSSPDLVKSLSSILKIPEETIIKNKGAWFVNVQKEPNYESLDFEDQKKINEQVNLMISYKYEFINYNGLRNSHLASLTNNYTINPFSNKVLIIDEAHNFISRIVNKLSRPSSLSMKMYNYLMEAENCKIILLSGTPIVNYPHEVAILFNILRGYIYTFTTKINDSKVTGKVVTQEYLIDLFQKKGIYNHIDTIEFNSLTKQLTITKNPFGFTKSSKESKNKLEFSHETFYVSEFKDALLEVLNSQNITIEGNKIQITPYKSLPDNFDKFKELFIDPKNQMKNTDMFKMRIIGLTSYFRSAQEQLMPKYEDDEIQILQIPMSDFQFGQYQEARIQERKVEKNNKSKKGKNKLQKDEIYSDSVSTYRIFSRAFCNFVFPKPDIKRPMPNKDDSIESAIGAVEDIENVGEDILDDTKAQDKLDDMDNNFEQEDLQDIKKQLSQAKDTSYPTRIQQALSELNKNSSKYLSLDKLGTYSPKFLTMLNNILDTSNRGIHLIYSQFKTLEGIGIFKIVLKENGFAEFKLKKSVSGEYSFEVNPDDIGKPMFASYSGDETPEEREIIKNVLNSNWKVVPSNIVTQLKTINPNNFYGEVIKILMITSSGAEGISLKNVRYVHITEPYWHPVRNQQVIGRARRICSHSELPKELQTVEVFIYLMKFTEKQLESISIDLKLNDVSKKDKKRVLTSDEFLFEISSIKEELNKELLTNVKKSAMDCSIHSRSSSKEKITCFTIGNATDDKMMYVPDIKAQDTDKVMQLNKKKVAIKLYKIRNTNYGLDKENNKVYDYDAYMKGELIHIGKLEIEKGKNKVVLND